MPCVHPLKKICHQIVHFHTNFSSNRILSVLNIIDSIYFKEMIHALMMHNKCTTTRHNEMSNDSLPHFYTIFNHLVYVAR
jgi:hypothetical protein